MKRIVYYLRNSTDQQEYQYQLEALQNVFDRRNDVELIKIYAEKISGYSNEGERPEMNRLLESVNRNEIDEIWGYDIQRISRQSIVLQLIVRDCSRNNVNVYFHVQNLNTLNPDGTANPITKMLVGLLGEFAEQDGKNFISKGKAGKLTKTRAGYYVGGTLPCGYTYINDLAKRTKTIIVDDTQKKVVEYIFNAYGNEKKTLARICNELNNLKVTDKSFSTVMELKGKGRNSDVWRYKTWNPTTLKRIIECSWYSEGFRIWKGEKIHLDEKLKFIPVELFKRANQQLSINKTGRTPKIHTYFINNKLYCSCGELMRPKKVGNSHSYVCNKIVLKNYDKGIKCVGGRSCQTEKLENSLWLLIKNNIPEFRSQVQEKTSKELKINNKIEQNNQIIKNIENITIDNLKASRKRNISVYVKFGGEDADFEKLINSIDKEILENEKNITNLLFENQNLNLSLENLDLADELQQNIERIESDKKLIKLYVNKLIKKVIVCGGLSGKQLNVFQIIWNIGINNDRPTYLFYLSRQIISPKFYFMSTDKDYVDISWDNKKTIFNINNSYENISIESSADCMMKKIDKLYNEFPENTKKIFSKFPIFHDVVIENKKLSINLGISDLVIVSKFKK